MLFGWILKNYTQYIFLKRFLFRNYAGKIKLFDFYDFQNFLILLKFNFLIFINFFFLPEIFKAH